MLFNITGFIVFLVISVIGFWSVGHEVYTVMKMSRLEYYQHTKNVKASVKNGINLGVIQSSISLVVTAWFADKLFM